MDYQKINHIQTIGELEKLGEVNKKNPELAILTLKNGDQYYYFYNEQEASVELIKELNSVGASKTKTYMHTPPKGTLGYTFTKDSDIDSQNDKDITRTRFVIFPKEKEVITVFSNKQPNPEPDGLLYHSYYNGSKLLHVFVDPINKSVNRVYERTSYDSCYRDEEYRAIAKDTDEHTMKIIAVPYYPSYIVITPKKGGKGTKQEIYSSDELRKIYDTTDDPGLKYQLKKNLPYFINKYIPEEKKDKISPLQELKNKKASVDLNTIPGIAIATSFDGFKSYYLCLENGNIEYIVSESRTNLGGIWFENTIDCTETRDPNIKAFSIKMYSKYNGDYDGYNKHYVLVNLKDKKKYKIGNFFERVGDSWQCLRRQHKKSTRQDICLIDARGNVHYGSTDKGVCDDKDVKYEKGLTLKEYTIGNKPLIIVRKNKEVVYATCEEKEFLTGEDLENYIKSLGENAYCKKDGHAKKHGEEDLKIRADIEKAIRLFNPSFMRGEFEQRPQEEIDKIEREVNVVGLRRQLAAQIEEAEKTKEELRALGVEPEGDAK